MTGSTEMCMLYSSNALHKPVLSVSPDYASHQRNLWLLCSLTLLALFVQALCLAFLLLLFALVSSLLDRV